MLQQPDRANEVKRLKESFESMGTMVGLMIKLHRREGSSPS
jgi:hypothetical protein